MTLLADKRGTAAVQTERQDFNFLINELANQPTPYSSAAFIAIDKT